MPEFSSLGGWMMLPIIVCSMAVIGITLERFWTLNPGKIAPKHLLGEVWNSIRTKQLDGESLKQLKQSSALGAILAAGISNSRHGRDVMKDSIEEAANGVIHDMERYLSLLSTIAAIAPLLGLLGTVIGMIKVFAVITILGVGNAGALAGGISEALITTAAGLITAIPAMIAYRFFQRRVDTLVVVMEQEAVKLVDAIHGDRKVDVKAV